MQVLRTGYLHGAPCTQMTEVPPDHILYDEALKIATEGGRRENDDRNDATAGEEAHGGGDDGEVGVVSRRQHPSEFYADRRDQDGDSRGAHAGASDSDGGGGGGDDSNSAVDGTSGQNQIRDDAEKGAATVVSKSLESAVKAPAEVGDSALQPEPHQTKYRRQRPPATADAGENEKLPPQRWMWTLEMKVER